MQDKENKRALSQPSSEGEGEEEAEKKLKHEQRVKKMKNVMCHGS